MSELNQIIDNHAVFHHRILERTAIDRRISTDFHIIANHNRRELLDFHPTLCTGRIAKAVRTDRGIGVNRAAPSDFDRVTNHCTGLDHRICTNIRAMTNIDARTEPDPITQHRVCFDTGARINGHCVTQLRTTSHHRGGMDSLRRTRVLIENSRGLGIAHIGGRTQ